ncbi:hypothetical protein BV898_17477 [Hypsibius exemplaris]|uniref:G-protein coupled receptors family 1 profile domain-containing protein n=1 Tax=Hypsibius exemplaris TaxID=2072580 RepID=A0A9X6NI52_HYPEX|nr:hypothetical protein BV898_17477 [Hypsibius exemplaris]
MVFAGTAWVLGVGASLPFAAGWGGYYGVTPVWGNCGLTRATATGLKFFGLIQIATVYLPAGFLTLLYMTILLKHKCVWFRMGVDVHLARPDCTSDEACRLNRRVALAKILCASSIWHCLCHFPGAIINSTPLVQIYTGRPLLQLWLYTIFLCGYILNPAFFFLMSREYRRGAQQVQKLAREGLMSRVRRSVDLIAGCGGSSPRITPKPDQQLDP